ncbi:aldehyde oxidase 6 isoform X2 [Denticeps clupeoides]|uniref:aldehyde oxidase 6 isoform X2 n=1 Tax=Denticeps clupeoides TaxID=299321 RepID=UPI0010A3B1AB|nr:aldehyde oxidase isoform X2 [Denticeps clupeoides]
MAEGTRCDYLTFFVNGKKVIERIVDPETTLLSYLRGKLRLTGTKYGCGGGGCGACTVMVSRYQTQTKRITHFPANACLLPVCQLQGAAVTTVEGIGSTKTRLHPVQERIAKAHGSQCGFCTPGMVMSMYALLRNQPQPTLDDITEALAGNLCRCTGYRPIVDGCKTFCENSNCCQLNGKECCLMNGAKPVENGENDFPELFNKADLLPLDPTQELIFPPELIMMAETQVPTTQTFCGERMTWVSPVSLDEVLDLKSAHPQAPILMGNTNVGPDIKFKGVVHPVIISPTRVPELFEVTRTPQGVSIGAGSSLAAVRAELESLVKELPEEHAELYRALLLQLGSLAGPQIRSVATLGGNVVSAYPNSDLNPVLAAGNCRVLAVSKGGRREIPINRDFFVGFGKTALKPDEIVLSVFIPVSKKGEFVRAFRQAPRKENALATVNAAMRVVFSEGSSMVHEISIFHGGVGPSTVYASKTCKQITGKPWSEETLNAAYPVLLEEMCLPPSAPGGKVDFRRAVSLSFLFKFFLQMQQKLHIMVQFMWCCSTGFARKYEEWNRTTTKPTAAQLPGVSGCASGAGQQGSGWPTPDAQVTCVGQMICAVAGDTKSYAKRGAAAVKITYEELPERVFTVEEAIQKQSFFQPQREIWRGDVSEGFRKAEHIHEGEIRLGGQEHFYMETQSMLVVPVGEEKELNVYLSTQHPAYAQESIAETLDIPSNRVSCHVKRIGGAFGGKVTKTCILASITAVAALKTERAVRLVLERGEDMLITGARHPVLGRYKVGYMNDGQIIAADIMYYTNAGNTADESLLVIEKILLHLDNAYSIPNLRGRSTACKTNLPSNTAFRGFGVPQSMLVTENMMNDVALRLGRAAEEIRDINMYKEVSLTHYKQMFDPLNLRRCWQECMEKSSYQSRRKDIDQFNQLNRWKKRGISVIPIKYGVGFAEGFLNQAAALVHIYKDGSVLVSHGGAEMGQGIHTKMQQVASRELQIPSNLIHISETSTNTVPNTCPSAASFGTDANGMAVKDACEILYNRLEPIRKKNPKGSWQAWISEAFLLKISLSATGYYRGPDCDMDWEKQEGAPYAYFTYGACCSEVEVDCLTGDYRTIRTDIVVDIGRSINPSVDIGQIEGAFVQGLGLYTMEELKFSPSGVLYTRGPGQYKIPAICDMPLKFNVYLLAGTQNPSAIYSSKGIGEPTLFLGSSVFFAIKDAVVAARRDAGMTGLFEFHSPATPERTCMACATHFARMVPESTASSVQPWAIESP